MELKGKKIAFLGDSITEGTGASSLEHVYWKVLERQTGAECHGYGIGGTRIAPQRTKSAEDRWDQYFGSRVDEMIPDADVVVVNVGDEVTISFDAETAGTLVEAYEVTVTGLAELPAEQESETLPAEQPEEVPTEETEESVEIPETAETA